MKSIVTGVGASICIALVASMGPSFPATATLSAQSAGEWQPLFNGKDLTGWTVDARRGGADAGSGGSSESPTWEVEDGVLVGGQGGGRGGSLVSDAQYKDFELELEFLLAEHGTQCSAELVGPEQENASVDKTCTFNGGVYFRTGYQVNIGRREAGEFIGIVVHRESPEAIRGNVLWLDTGDEKFPDLRKKGAWNQLRITAKGSQIVVTLNGTQICDVTDNPTDPAEAAWKEAGPIRLQWPPAGEAGGFNGFVKYRNMRIRAL